MAPTWAQRCTLWAGVVAQIHALDPFTRDVSVFQHSYYQVKDRCYQVEDITLYLIR